MKKYLLGLAVAFALVSASSADAYTYTRSLTLGASGADVVALQTMLVAQGHLVMPAGVSMGYFGTLTQSAVAKWQAANGIAPAVGFFGPISIARASTMTGVVGGSTSVTPGCVAGATFSSTTGAPCSSTVIAGCVAGALFSSTTGQSCSGSTGTSATLSGSEGDIKALTVLASPSNEDISEGEEVKVFGFEIEASDDSDLKLERVDIVLDGTVDGSKTKRHWRVFQSATLYAGTKEVSSISRLDRSSNWSEVTSDVYRIRFTGVDTVIKAGQKQRFYVELEAQSTLKNTNYSSGNDYTIYIPANGVRVLDAAGIDSTAPSSPSASKNIDVKDVTSADITILESSDNPKSKTIIVDENKTTDNVVVLIAEIESEEDDVTLETLRVYATSTGISVYAMLSDLVIEIDGEEFSGTIASTTAMSTYYTFDIDGDVEISEDDMVEAVVLASFNKDVAGTIVFSLNSEGFEAESVASGETVTSIAGSADGNVMTVSLVGVDVTLKSTLNVTSADGPTNDYSKATFEVKITNKGSDTIFVPLTASASTTVATTQGINFKALSQAGTSTIVVDQITNRTEQSNSVRLQKGQDATIEVVVTFLPGVAMTTQRYELSTVRFSKTAGNVDEVYTAPDTSDYRTNTVTLVN